MLISTLPRPAVASPEPWIPPEPDRFTLGNGLTVCSLHVPGQPVLTLHVHLGIDLHAEPSGHDGVAILMADCLNRGTANFTATEFAAALAEFGIDWSTTIDHTGPRIVCQMPAQHLDTTLDMVAEGVVAPALRPAKISAARELLQAELADADSDAPTRAERRLPGLIFDPSTRHGRPADGTPSSVAKIRIDDVADFHRTQLRMDNITLVIAGDLAGLDVATIAEAGLGHLTTPTRQGAGLDSSLPVLRDRPISLLLNQAGVPQTHLMFAAPTISRPHPDWPALTTAMHILGAPITGRLDKHLRETAGHTYRFATSLPALTAESGQVVISASVDEARTTIAANDLLAQLDTAHHSGFTDGECDQAKIALLRSLPLSYEHAELVAAALTDQLTHRLRPDFHRHCLTRIRALTPDDINHAYRTHINPDQLRFAAIGPPHALEALAAAKILPTV